MVLGQSQEGQRTGTLLEFSAAEISCVLHFAVQQLQGNSVMSQISLGVTNPFSPAFPLAGRCCSGACVPQLLLTQTSHSRAVWAVTPVATAAGPAHGWVAMPTAQPSCSQSFLLSVMAALKSCQTVNPMQRWTAPTLHWELLQARSCPPLHAHSPCGLPKPSCTREMKAAGCMLCILLAPRRAQNWEWKNESEWKQDHNFGRSKNCKKEDIET